MKNILFALCSGLLLCFSACTKDVPAPTVTTMSNTTSFTFISKKTGVIIQQNSSNAAGTIELGVDSVNNHFLKLKSDFKTTFATGATQNAVLSTTATYDENTGASVGTVTANGERYYNISTFQFNNATYFILYNATSNTTLGNAQIKPL